MLTSVPSFARRDTPLHCAAQWSDGHGDVVAALIGAGADVTIENVHGYAAAGGPFSGGAAGAAGWASAAAVAHRNTPLHCAAANGNGDVVAALINAGASVNIQNRKRWAFWRRCGRCGGRASAAAGAAVARRNTPLHLVIDLPLHLAAARGNAFVIDVVTALIGAGADMTLKNIEGYAALCRMADRHSRSPYARRMTAEQLWLARDGGLAERITDSFHSWFARALFATEQEITAQQEARQEARRNEKIAKYEAAVEQVRVRSSRHRSPTRTHHHYTAFIS